MPKLPNWIILSKIFIFLVILVMIFFCLNIWKYLLSNLNLVISTYYLAIEWWLGCGVFTFWLDGGAIILNQRLETNTETAKLNNPVKNIYFLRDIGYDFFLLKQLKDSIVKPESGHFNLLFWQLKDCLVVGSLLFDWMVG